MGPPARRTVPVVAGLLALMALAQSAYFAASLARPPLEIDIGPNTGRYLDGFTESEERLPVTFRWTRERASVTLPLTGRGETASLELRVARFLERNAQLHLFVDGEPSGSVSVRSGRFRTMTMPLRLDGTAPVLSLLLEDPAAEKLGVAIDWVRIVDARWSLPAGAPLVLVAGTFLLVIALGFSVGTAGAVGGGVVVVQAFWLARDPFAMSHVHDELTVTALFLAAAVAVVVLMSGARRVLPLLFLFGYLLRGALLFDPSFWYPDVRLHRRYVEVFRQADGNLLERGLEAQKGSYTAYPRKLAGRNYALPYSPLFYVPFASGARDARALEASMKRTGLALATAELLAIYALATALFGARTAVWACLVSLFLPPISSRLLFAQWPTLFGHLLDVIAIGFGARLLRTTNGTGALVGYGVSLLVAFLSYISSLFTLTCFTTALAIVDRKRFVPIVAVGAAAGVVTLLVLYLPFLRILFGEILPNATRGAGGAGADAIGLVGSLGHVHTFYGVGFPALAIAGFWLSRPNPAAFRLLAAYAGAIATLLLLRSWSGALKDLKELVFMGPFIAITVGLSLETLAARGRYGRLSTGAIAVGLVGFAIAKFGEYAALHTKLAGLE